MSKKAKAPRPKNIPPKGMKHNPYFQLPYAAIDVALDSKLTAGALRCLLFALKADRGNYKQLNLGINRGSTGARSGRNTVINGLDQLVACGLLIEVNKLGVYRLGPMFDKYIPDENFSNDVVTGDQVLLSAQLASTSYADRMLAIWNELHDEDHREPDLDDEARDRAEMWAEKRTRAGADPVADFRLAAGFFMEHGHEIPREGDKERNPAAYSFRGFMKVCPMFFKQAMAAGRKDVTPEPAESTDIGVPAPSPVSGTNSDDESAQTNNLDIPKKYRSFIVGKDADGKFTYRDGPATSVEELARIYEHAFQRIGVTVSMTGQKTMENCAQDFQGILDGKKVSLVIRMIATAKRISEDESQREYFDVHPFSYNTARTVFPDALTWVQQMDYQHAKSVADREKRIESGEILKENMNAISTALENFARYYVEDIDFIAERWQERAEGEMSRALDGLSRDYGDDCPDISDPNIISGLRCLSFLGIIDIPEYLNDAVGSGPWTPTFDWIRDKQVKERFFEKAQGALGVADTPINHQLTQDEIQKLLTGRIASQGEGILSPQHSHLNPYMENSHTSPDDDDQPT